jgi:GMP synthase-like glutamine amidotransferase
MDFRKATDELLACISHQELADALGVSVATVRQARLDSAAKAHRSPPEAWEAAVARLARAQGDRLLRLAKRLKAKA